MSSRAGKGQLTSFDFNMKLNLSGCLTSVFPNDPAQRLFYNNFTCQTRICKRTGKPKKMHTLIELKTKAHQKDI